MTKRRTSRRPKRTSKNPTKRTSRRVHQNPIPPPPQALTHGVDDLEKWSRRTFAPGTPVKFWGGGVGWYPGGPHDLRTSTVAALVPDGTRGTVVAVTRNDAYNYPLQITVRVVDARSYSYVADAAPGEAQSWVAADIEDMWKLLDAKNTNLLTRPIGSHILTWLVPLDDNWAPHQTRPSSMKHRRLAPNATCPSCGSHDYFEGIWNRDCANRDCRYYIGGTVGGGVAPEAAAQLGGSRRLGFTSETVHASEPDVYPEIDHESLSDIEIDAADLDEGESFAQRAAKIIAEELGHVEGSDYPGPARWYTQSDANEDYATGSSTRRSIHIDDDQWSPEEQQEIYDELKRRRLL